MNPKTSHTRRALTLLLAVLLTLALFPTAVFAGQEPSYHDPAEHWIKALSRTNELDVNAIVTQETLYCFHCDMDTGFTVWRTPEYTRDGNSAMTRNVRYSDGTLLGGSGSGSIFDGIPGDTASYSGYHWTKSCCNTCGTLNANLGQPDYSYGRNVYLLYDCAAGFTEQLDEQVRDVSADDSYHTKAVNGGSYCAFCYGTRHSHTETLEKHTLRTDVLPQIDKQRFAVVTRCELCDYTADAFVAAKSVVASYFGTVDGQAHTITVTDLSESGVSTRIRYGNSADACTLSNPPSYTEEGQYTVYYSVTYSYQGVSMEENGVAYVWLRDDSLPEIQGCVCGCGEAGCDCENGTCPHCSQFDCARGIHNYVFLDTVPPTCTELGYDRWFCPLCGSVEKRAYVNTEGHVWQSVVIREADCEHGGLVMDTCRSCGETRVITTEKGDHSWNPYTVAATCTSPGYAGKECVHCGARQITDIGSVLGHSYQTVVTPPSCVTGGMTLHVCARCGQSYTDSYTEASGHSWDRGETIVAPGCVNEGVKEYVCESCGISKIERVPATGHSPGPAASCTEDQLCLRCGAVLAQHSGHSYDSAVVAPGCEHMGYTVFTCSVCGDTGKSNYTDPIGHNYAAVVTPPSCADMGYTTYTCTRCSDSYMDRFVPALDHDWDKGTVIANATCLGAGVVEHRCNRCDASYLEASDAVGHTPGPAATCTQPQLCTVCGAVITPAKGHRHTATVTAPTCDSMGYTSYVCADCGDSYRGDYTNALGHAYVAEVTAPTCTEEGFTTCTCARCGDSYITDRVPVHGHSYDAGTVLVHPSCTTEGLRLFVCSGCGKEHSETIPAVGHTPGCAATCTQPQFCTTCGMILSAAHGHSYALEVTAPSCERMGYTTYTCQACGESFRANYTDALGHSYKVVVTAPTCTGRGFTTYTCSRCADSYVDDDTAPLGHRWDAGTKLTDASCTGDGVTVYRCLDCSAACLQAVSATGHNPGPEADCAHPQICLDCGAVLVQARGHSYEAQVTAPGCTEMGYTSYTCSHCGVSYRSDYTPAAGHSESDWITDREPSAEAEGQRHRVCTVCGETLITETIAKLYNLGTTDSRGEAIVGIYLVIVTDADTGNPVANATVFLNQNGAISIRLPDGRLLDYADRTTVTVLLRADRTPLQDVLIVITDRNGNYSAGDTDTQGQLTVPAPSGVTGPDGTITFGWEDADGVRHTITIRVQRHENARPVVGAVVTVGRTGRITVVLPDGIDLDGNNRIVITLTDRLLAPLTGWLILVKGDRNSAEGETDGNGSLTVPEQLRREQHPVYIVGYPDGSFGPERSMTRAEASAIFARLLAEKMGNALAPVENAGFADIDAYAWYSGYVRYLARRGIVYGVEENSFSPDTPITRAEFVAMAVRFFAAYGDGNPAIQEQYTEFTDVAEGYWAAAYIKDAALYGWVRGYGDGTFRATQQITRAEVVTIVNRLLGRAADQAYLAANLRSLNTFTDMQEAHWAYYEVMEAANGHRAEYNPTEIWSR